MCVAFRLEAAIIVELILFFCGSGFCSQQFLVFLFGDGTMLLDFSRMGKQTCVFMSQYNINKLLISYLSPLVIGKYILMVPVVIFLRHH